MHIIKQDYNFVNYAASTVPVVAVGGLAAGRRNRGTLSIDIERTPGEVAVMALTADWPAEIRRPVTIPSINTSANIGTSVLIRNIRRAVRAYKERIALTFLGSIYAHAGFVVGGVA